jgi:hypothetical protein
MKFSEFQMILNYQIYIQRVSDSTPCSFSCSLIHEIVNFKVNAHTMPFRSNMYLAIIFIFINLTLNYYPYIISSHYFYLLNLISLHIYLHSFFPFSITHGIIISYLPHSCYLLNLVFQSITFNGRLV